MQTVPQPSVDCRGAAEVLLAAVLNSDRQGHLYVCAANLSLTLLARAALSLVLYFYEPARVNGLAAAQVGYVLSWGICKTVEFHYWSQ